eukprot:TRINITY_DN7231_c0_g4_i1.p2 TRINITY_DN7231_c0_g4~~TRINITY_DN7231_c0_g4_i1.p2  ORF type:complete len:327 (+),score=62.15 TRINITY_DN7231_c0_g4_i1:80-982(+)
MPFEQLALALTCSNLGVLASAKWSNLFHGNWYRRAPAVVLHIMFAAYIIMMIFAWRFDAKKHVQCGFKSELLLVEGEEEAECWLKAIWKDVVQTMVLDTIGVIKNADKLKFVAAVGAEGSGAEPEAEPSEDNVAASNSKPKLEPASADRRSLCTRCCARVKGYLTRYVNSFLNFAAVCILSVSAEVDKDDLRHHANLAKNAEAEISSAEAQEHHKKACQQLSPYILKRASAGYAETFGHDLVGLSPLKDMISLLLSQTPMHGTFRYSVFISASMQAAMLGASILGPAFIAALFYSTSANL